MARPLNDLHRYAIAKNSRRTGCDRTGGLSPGPTTPAGTGRPSDLEIPAPAFQMTERSGKPVALDDLKGKVWVASFVFTRCSGPCPQVSATMARLQKELNLKETADLRLVTFTVDPDRDTPNESEGVREPLPGRPGAMAVPDRLAGGGATQALEGRLQGVGAAEFVTEGGRGVRSQLAAGGRGQERRDPRVLRRGPVVEQHSC